MTKELTRKERQETQPVGEFTPAETDIEQVRDFRKV